MAYKDILKKKVPEEVRFTPEFRVLLAVIKKQDIKSSMGLKNYTNSEIKSLKDWIKTNKKQNIKGTMRRHIVKKQKQIDFYALIKKQVLKYL